MIKFIHKKHPNGDVAKGNIIIYYSVSDIILGAMLLALTVFFMHDYLSHSLNKQNNNCSFYPRIISDIQTNKK